MKTFPKDDQAKIICHTWADHFKTMGMMEDYMFWQVVGLGFEIGGTVQSPSIMAKINRTIQSRIAAPKMAAIFPSNAGKVLITFSREAKYLDMILTHSRD